MDLRFPGGAAKGGGEPPTFLPPKEHKIHQGYLSLSQRVCTCLISCVTQSRFDPALPECSHVILTLVQFPLPSIMFLSYLQGLTLFRVASLVETGNINHIHRPFSS